MQFVELDPRIIKVGLEINGQLKTYEGLAIEASGTKYANANQNECEVTIYNLDKSTRDYILTETSPFNLNRTPKILILEAGRKSYGTTKIYVGNISTTGRAKKKSTTSGQINKTDDPNKGGGSASVSANVSQPPDIGITLKCLTGDFDKGNIIARSQPGIAPLSQISSQVSRDLNAILDFQATDKQIASYTYSGAALKQIDYLNQVGLVNAYLDDGVLVVKDFNKPLSNKVKILSKDTGMIGIPEITEQGIKVQFLLDNQTTLGGILRINSQLYPVVNGDYMIYRLSFEIASRDVPFYWIAEAKRL